MLTIKFRSLQDVRRLVEVTAKKSLNIFKPDLSYEKNGLLWEIDDSEIIQEDASSKHFLQKTLPELTNKVVKQMGLNLLGLEVKPILKNLFVCGTGGSVKFTHSSTNGNSFI